MKLKTDPRHQKRIKLMQKLYTWEFLKNNPKGQIKQIVENLPQIDKKIASAAKDRPLSEINRIDFSILRLAVFELIIKRTEPAKVIIDEAVELGKQFGSDSSGSFINGALGQVVNLNKIKT